MTTSTDGLALATRELRKSYGSRAALNGLDLSVPTGVVYGFLGPNGAEDGDHAAHDRRSTRTQAGSGPGPTSAAEIARSLGWGAVESPSFYPFLNARENLRAMGASGARTTSARIEELLDLVGLQDRARDKVGGYSLGMKQRLGIASALLSDPKLLLLDEPANGLDPAGIVAMRETLRHLASTGKTVFVSSHLLAEVQQMADVIGIIAAVSSSRKGRWRPCSRAKTRSRCVWAPIRSPPHAS
jgi:ABC-2 type transport system ATP-binding protein